MRRTVLMIAAVTVGIAGPALAGSRLTQIEPRPTYGATVTIEEGVRVFRPLPANRHVIVNPNRTPLLLDAGETTTINQIDNSSTAVIKRRGY